MNKKVKSLILCGVVLVLLVGALLLLLFLPKGGEGSSSSQESSAVYSSTTVQIYTGDPANVRSVKVEGQKGDYQVQREAEGLYAIEELEGLDQLTDSYNTLVSQFASVTATRQIEENPSDLVKYGLKDPQMTVTVTYADSSSHEVRVGNALPTADGYYVQVDEDSTVYAIGSSKFAAADKRLLDFVSTQVIDVWTAPVDKDGNATQSAPVIDYLEIEGATFTEYGLFRMEAIDINSDDTTAAYSSGYRIVSPIKADFRFRSDSDGNDLNAVYTSKLADYAAEHVADIHPDETALENYGFTEPYAVIRFSRDGEEHVWTFGSEVPTTGGATGRYLMADGKPVVYVAAVANTPWLTANMEDLYSTLMVVPNINDVDRVEVMAGGEDYEILVTGTDDQLVAVMNGTELDTKIYRKFYQYLLSAPAEELNRGSQRGEKVASITYHYRDTTKGEETLEFYDIGNRRCIISLNGEDTYICRYTYVEYLIKNCEKALAGETPVLDY